MVVKGKYSFNAEMVYQDKTRAVGEAQLPVVKLPEYCLCSSFNVGGDFKDVDVAFVHLVHEFDSGSVAASHLKEGISLVQDIIGCIKDGLFLLKFYMNGFGFRVVLVIGDGEGAEGAGINKDLQYGASPYRYLS